MQTISTKLYPLLTSLIDESYTDGIDRISSARENDDGSVLIVGLDGAKQIAAKITDGNIKIRLLNPDAVSTKSAAFSSANIYEQLGMRLLELALEAEFAAPKKSNGTLKKKTCKTGLSCGGACISKTKICARALSIEQQKQFKELKKRLKGGDADAVKGIEDLKNEQQGSKSQSSPKSEAKVEAKPTSEPKKMTIPTPPADRQKAMYFNVKDIKTSSKASDFDPKEIESIANSILDAGGLYRPLLVEQDGQGYKLLPGHEINYHASVRARELDLKKGEEVNAFLVAKGYTQSSIDQVDRLTASNSNPTKPEGDFIKPFRSSEGADKKVYYIETSAIKSSRPASDFDPKEIEDMADSILANGGLLRPMVLAQKTYDTYDVLDGHLAYHASVRAKQKDPQRAEEVNGFIISPDNIDNVLKQLKLAK